MRLESKKYLHDIKTATELLNSFIAGKSFADYSNDPMLRSAVERQFEIVGEALAQLAKVDESSVKEISEFRRIIAFRNILIHGYAHVDDRLVWDIAQTRLAALQSQVTDLLESP